MPDQYNRRSFLAGVLACGTLSASAGYLLQGSPRAGIKLVLDSGADSTGGRKAVIGLWNERHPDVQLALNEVPSETGGQKLTMRNHAVDGSADIINLDVIHVPEFAAADLIVPLELDGPNEYLDPLLHPLRHREDPGRYWAAPFNTDVGMMFQRLTDGSSDTDRQTLKEVLAQRAPDGSGRFVGQLRPQTSTAREAFVVNVLEHALAQDPGILGGDGVVSQDPRRWTQALRPLRDYVNTPKTPVASDENETVVVFDRLRSPYMRNWPVYYRRYKQNGQFGGRGVVVSSLPVGILGGQCLAVVKAGRHLDEAAAAVRFLTATPAQKTLALHGLAPTRMGAYDDADLKDLMPHLEAVRGAVEGSRPRPVHPDYAIFSRVVHDNVRSHLYEGADLGSDLITGMTLALTRRRW
ncbi:MAG TPA: extracellular solute-binding protein [Actinoplanes sp.]|jgi:multiple sugar transport system substrate-binding protein